MTKELIALLGVDAHTSITRRAARESWQSRPRDGRGGGKEWLLASMPKATRMRIAQALNTRAMRSATPPTAPVPSSPLFTVNTPCSAASTLPPAKRDRAEARALAVRAAQRFYSVSGLTRTAAFEWFAVQYNQGQTNAPAWATDVLPRISRASLLNWEKLLYAEGLAALGGKQGQHRKGTGALDQPYVLTFCLGHIYQFPHAGAHQIHKGLTARFALAKRPEKLPSLRRVQDWYKEWRTEHAELFLAMSNPDEWRNKCRVAFGDADFLVSRLNQEWEMDSTPCDLILADGKRYSIVACIDVYSRRVKFRVSRTSSSHAVATTLYECILAWGIPELVRTDNGADYVSRYVQSTLLRLNILPDICEPFSPEQKPFVERVFRTFLYDNIELLCGYIGHNVSQRKALEARKSFARRMFSKDERVELKVTREELQSICDQWAENTYAHREHSGIGTTPYFRAQQWDEPVRMVEDELALSLLFLPVPDNDGIRTVTKDGGVRCFNDSYLAPELGRYVRRQVQVRVNDADYGQVYIYSMDGEQFICIARGVKHSDLSNKEVREISKKAQAMQAKEKRECVAAMAACAKEADVQDIAYERMLADKERAERIRAEHPIRARAVPHTTAALESAAQAARAEAPAAPVPVTEAERQAKETARRALAAASAPSAPVETPEHRFWRAHKIEEALELHAKNLGPLPDTTDVRWLHAYRTTPEYDSQKRLHACFGDARYLARVAGA